MSSEPFDAAATTMIGDDIAIKVENLGKMYRIYDQPVDRLKQMLWGRYRATGYGREFWAVKDLSFQVRRGESIGIVGRNGSGKSTLLQLIVGTLTPTAGVVESRGKMVALLELGSGFNHEFTGRENLALYRSLCGIGNVSNEEFASKAIEFSELGSFIDQPVKAYSSGMAMRLAFAAATQVDPEILVVDEALAVGDAQFSRKCLSRIERLREKGCSIVLVSHAQEMIINHCDRAMLMDGGELIAFGDVNPVCKTYMRLAFSEGPERAVYREKIRRGNLEIENETASGLQSLHSADGFLIDGLQSTSAVEWQSHGVLLSNPRIVNSSGELVNVLVRGHNYSCEYDVCTTKACSNIRYGMMIKSISGIEIGGIFSALPGNGETLQSFSSTKAKIRFGVKLNPGTYAINIGCMGDIDEVRGGILHRIVDALLFRVVDDGNRLSTAMVDFTCDSPGN